jgi:hypothetical protein
MHALPRAEGRRSQRFASGPPWGPSHEPVHEVRVELRSFQGCPPERVPAATRLAHRSALVPADCVGRRPLPVRVRAIARGLLARCRRRRVQVETVGYLLVQLSPALARLTRALEVVCPRRCPRPPMRVPRGHQIGQAHPRVGFRSRYVPASARLRVPRRRSRPGFRCRLKVASPARRPAKFLLPLGAFRATGDRPRSRPLATRVRRSGGGGAALRLLPR